MENLVANFDDDDNKRYLYRCSDGFYQGEPYYASFAIVKETECFYFISTPDSESKKVGKNSARPYAYNTKEKAMSSYLHRKSKQLFLIENQLQLIKSRILALKKNNLIVPKHKINFGFVNEI